MASRDAPAATAGHRIFARYAFPPNELGYCGPDDSAILLRTGTDVAAVARRFDGAWPYLKAIADAALVDDPLDEEVVTSYWIGGPLLGRVDAGTLWQRLAAAFAGQTTGLLEAAGGRHVIAHHSFHVFVVYPWVRFLDSDPTTPLHVLQSCRIRWGTVTDVDDEHVTMASEPLTCDAGLLRLVDATPQRVRWRRGDRSLVAEPVVGATVAAHWDWVCGMLRPDQCEALAGATQHTLDLVNTVRNRSADHH